MVNQYGQTDLTQALLAQGTSPSPYKTGLGQAARLGGIALAEWGKRKKAEQNRSALADALAGLNGGALTGEGPTTDAAGRAPIGDPQLLARLLSDPNTAGVGQALLGRALQPAPERYEPVMGPQGRPIGQRSSVTGKVEPYPKNPYAEKPPTPTSAMLEYGMAKEQGYPGSFQQYQIDMKRAGASNTTVNNKLPSNVQETEEAKKYGADLVSQWTGIREAAENAQAQRAMLRQAQIINDNPTGKEGFPMAGLLKQKAGNAIAAFGIDPATVPGFESISSGQQFNGVMQNIVLTQMQAQKGPQTENDAKRIEQTVASLGNTPQAREFLLESAMAVNDMKILKRDFWQRYKNETGSFNGAGTAWRDSLGGAGMVRKHPKHGFIMFLPEWFSENRAHPDNAGKTDAEILKVWKSYE